MTSETASSPPSNRPKVTIEELKRVQSLIEKCLLSYMSKEDVVQYLFNQAHIEPVLTRIGIHSLCRKESALTVSQSLTNLTSLSVWNKLEQANKEFFQAYYIRVKIREQIEAFNYLMSQQASIMQKLYQPQPPNVPPPPTKTSRRSKSSRARDSS